MHVRCYNPKSPSYRAYGGRGIQVCSRWHRFETFLADMGERPGDDWSIEREDVNGNYEPDNCCWALADTQAANRQNTVRLTLNGQTHHLNEWARLTAISSRTIRNRLALGWTVEDTLTRPVKARKNNYP